eukprot:7824336-Prorocentrum_lima.AAC.1
MGTAAAQDFVELLNNIETMGGLANHNPQNQSRTSGKALKHKWQQRAAGKTYWCYLAGLQSM